jgi:toxin HigB-1
VGLLAVLVESVYPIRPSIDKRYLTGYSRTDVRIRSFAHTGLKRLYLRDQARGLPTEAVDKLRKMLAFLQDMERAEEVRTMPGWRAHQLTGDRQGTWSLRVTGSWRLTFRVTDGELVEVNYEDYHD